MAECSRCFKPLSGKTFYSDPQIIGTIVCKSCFLIACEDIGRDDLIFQHKDD
jgi:hypothetical protein